MANDAHKSPDMMPSQGELRVGIVQYKCSSSWRIDEPEEAFHGPLQGEARCAFLVIRTITPILDAAVGDVAQRYWRRKQPFPQLR